MGKIALWAMRPGGRNYQEQLARMRAIFEALLPTIGGGEHEGSGPIALGHVETSLSDDGRIRTPEGVPPEDLSDAIKRYWPESIWTDAARVSYHESSWRATAERNTLARAGGRCNVPIGYLDDGTPIVSEQSVGYYQINVCAHHHDRDYWANADNNVGYARRLYDEGGWRPWTVTAKKLGLL